MTDIVIHRCKFRIVRHHGWAWGPEPQRLLQSAVHVLPDIVARQLAGLWQEGEDREITAPVRITIPVHMSELMAVHAPNPDDESAFDARPLTAFHARITHTLKETFLRDPPTTAETVLDKPRHNHTSQVEETEVAPELRWSGTVLRLLLSWRNQGVLETRLAFCSLPSLEAWHQSLCTTNLQPFSPATAVPLETVETVLRDLKTFQTPALDRAGLLRQWVVVAIELAHKLGMPPSDPVVQHALDQAIFFPAVKLNTSVAEPTLPQLAQSLKKTEEVESIQSTLPSLASVRPAKRQKQVRAPSSSNVLYEGEIAIASALPFLLLGPLARLGYWQTLTAVFEAADLLPQIHLFATALAHKVLDPPERGWRRHPAASVCAASFAALAEPAPEPELAAFAQQIAQHLSPLDAVLADGLVTGHNPQKPLLLHRTEPTKGLLLVDVEGASPIAWDHSLTALLSILARCQGSLLLVPKAAADVQLLDRLDSANIRFMTDAPPTRGEAWRSLWHPSGHRWWTNDTSTAASSLVQAALLLADTAEETATLWRMLARERPSIPTVPNAALDQSLTLAAATALGTIAWTLWRERESVAPSLTLERFRDLDARVHFSREAVRVRLPLGRRYRDLYEHGLLADVLEIPWLDGRILRFSGG